MDSERADRAAIAAVASGDRRALEELYARHRHGLWAFIRRYVADEQLAEEALADTLVALWRHAASFRGEARVSTWLFGIARRQAHNHVRRRRPVPVDHDTALAVVADTDPDPERIVASRDELDHVNARIEALSDEHREALLLSIAGDLSYAEIAELLQVPVGTVKSRVANARRNLGAARSESPDEEMRR